MGISVLIRISARDGSKFAGILRSVKLCGRNRMMTSSSSGSVNSDEKADSRLRISPWLMLRPHFKSGDMVYRFYSLQHKEVVRIDKRRGGGGGGEVPADACKIVGSSHGWLALFNERNDDLFLSDPVNRRHIKLPSIDSLEIETINGCGRVCKVSKVILSCSADDEQECRAMMTFGAGDRLAICSPARSTEWTPVGGLYMEPTVLDHAKVYEDFVYCSRRKVFSCITPFEMDPRWFHQSTDYRCRKEDWDILDCRSPKIIQVLEFDKWADSDSVPAWVENMRQNLDDDSVQITRLVYAEESDQLFLVVRFVKGLPIPDDNPYLINRFEFAEGHDISYQTVGFIVLRVDEADAEYGDCPLTVVNSLDGLAMFVGTNHSLAISTSNFPELNLKPNSIYFTDDVNRFRGRNNRHDIGIFDYEKNVISPCYNFPTHNDSGSCKWIRSPPLWFTPGIKFH